MKNRNPLFFVGTGRCGTTSIAFSLAHSVNNVIVVHEGDRIYGLERLPLYVDKPSIKRLSDKDNIEIQNGNLEIARKNFLKREVFIKEHERKNCRYIESNNFAWPYIPIIREKFPNSFIVHLIRNPYDCISSLYSWGVYVIKDHYNDARKRFKSNNRLEEICYYWEYVNKSILNLNPDRVLRLEDLTKETLSDILKECGLSHLPPDIEKINTLPSRIKRETVIHTVNKCLSIDTFNLFKYNKT